MGLTNQDFTIYAGETRNLKVYVTNSNGDPQDLTGASIAWEVQRNFICNTMEITKTTGSGITITDPLGGIFTISLLPSDSTNLKGTYYHEARVTDVLGNVITVLTGKMTVNQTAIGAT